MKISTGRQHGVALSKAASRLVAARINTILGALVMGIVLGLPAVAYMLLDNFSSLAGMVSAKPEISLFLKADYPRPQALALEKQLRQDTALAAVRFVPKEEALARLRQSQGLAEVVDSLPSNPLPDAFIVLPANESSFALEALRGRLAKLEGVEQVQLDSAWVKRLHALGEAGRMALLLLSGLLAVAVLAVTFNTIRLQILTLREEIEISQLLGADDTYIRRPFYYFGLLQGLLGGLVAWGLVSLTSITLRPALGQLAAAYNLDLALRGPSVQQSLSLLLIAATLGWLGTWLSVRQFLR